MDPQPGATPPELEGYLAPNERVVTAVHQHWFSLWPQILAAVGATALAFYIDINASATRAGRSAGDVGWFLWVAAVLWLLWAVLNWRHDWFIATDKRLLMFYGFIRRKVAMMPMLKVTDMTFERSPLGRVLGYGTFILESAGQTQALARVDFVPDADVHYQRIISVLFGPASSGPGGQGLRGPDGTYGTGGPGGPSGGGWPGGPGDAGTDIHPARPYEGQHVRPVRTEDSRTVPPSPPPARSADDVFDYEAPVAGESLYRSEDLVHTEREADTGEIPVIRARPLPPPRQSW